MNALQRAILGRLQSLRDEGRIELFDPGGGHGQGWRIPGTDIRGSIPMTSHGLRNLTAAIGQLRRALQEIGIDLGV